MGVINQYTDGEYLVTEYDSGVTERVINQEGKSGPAAPTITVTLVEIKASLDLLAAEVAEIKAQTKVKA